MQILDGRVVAEARRLLIRDKVTAFQVSRGRPPGLAVILVGADPASQVYVKNKLKACQAVGIHSTEHRLPADASATQLRDRIDQLNHTPEVDGILLQLPLPRHLQAEECINWISPHKDADCLTTENLGLLWSGRPRTIPCTPWGVMMILEHFGIAVEGTNAVVIGRSSIVGKPMAHLLTQANATVTVCHSKTQDLSEYTRRAELIVVAAGKPEFLGRADFSPGAVVVDVGIHRQAGATGSMQLCGDVRYSELKDYARAATPVPGGVGPMTITMLLENTLLLASKH